MAFANSTKTLYDFKESFERRTGESVRSDDDVIDAYNEFLSIAQRAEREEYPQRYRAENASVTIGSSGYALSNLTNLGSDANQIFLYSGSVKVENILPLVAPDSSNTGYYISGGYIYLRPSGTEKDVIIQYTTKTGQVALGADLADTAFAFDKDAEMIFDRWMRSMFYDGEFQYDKMSLYEDKFYQELKRFFSRGANLLFV